MISGRTGSAAHVTESTDGNANAFVILIDSGGERERNAGLASKSLKSGRGRTSESVG